MEREESGEVQARAKKDGIRGRGGGGEVRRKGTEDEEEAGTSWPGGSRKEARGKVRCRQACFVG